MKAWTKELGKIKNERRKYLYVTEKGSYYHLNKKLRNMEIWDFIM